MQPLEAHSRDTIQSVQAFLHILVSDPGDHDSGQILTESIFRHLCMQLGACRGITRQTSTALGYVKKVTPEPSVIAVLRHSLLDRLLHRGQEQACGALHLLTFLPSDRGVRAGLLKSVHHSICPNGIVDDHSSLRL